MADQLRSARVKRLLANLSPTPSPDGGGAATPGPPAPGGASPVPGVDMKKKRRPPKGAGAGNVDGTSGGQGGRPGLGRQDDEEQADMPGIVAGEY